VRTGAGERVVLAHCVGTRRVAFVVGNAWSLFPQERLRCVFLTALTRGRLFVPGTNPLRGPHSSFVDGGCSGNLRFFWVVAGRGRESVRARSAGSVFTGRRALLNIPIFLCYVLYIEQWEFRCCMPSDHRERCPRSSMPWADTCVVQVSHPDDLFHVLKTVKGLLNLVPPRTPRSSGYGVLCTCGLCYMLFLLYF
jgi:hypothetical protein